jgi:hypothetical protein
MGSSVPSTAGLIPSFRSALRREKSLRQGTVGENETRQGPGSQGPAGGIQGRHEEGLACRLTRESAESRGRPQNRGRSLWLHEAD